MRISEEDKGRLLIQRGFTSEEIESGFRDYISGNLEWNIMSISPEGLRDTYNIEDMAKLFCRDSIRQVMCSTAWGSDFSRYSQMRDGSIPAQVNAPILEPYVARLVLAANRCCIMTSMSCDGWHHDRDGRVREISVWMSDKYSTLWFWIIAETVFRERWPKKEPYKASWEGVFEPDDNPDQVTGSVNPPTKVVCKVAKDDEANAYRKINRYAEFMELYCGRLCDIRNKWICSLQDKMSDIEIMEQSFLGLRRCIIESVRNELDDLSKKWRSMGSGSSAGVQAWDFAESRYLKCPISEKDEAKALGARFDGRNKKWYISWEADPAPFARWL